MHAIDLTGRRFGRWTVVRRAANPDGGQARWECVCECGTRKVVKSIALRRGLSQSCGCLKRERLAERARHGHARTGKLTPTYYSWAGMLARCENPDHVAFMRYGGRGIRVCAQWHDFEQFLADMGDKPRGTSLDRIDTDGDYTPANCRWASSRTQARNTSLNHRLTYQGETLCVAEWAERLGMHPASLNDRLQSGWSVERTLTTPTGTRNDNVKSRRITARGETHTLAEWARILGTKPVTLHMRLKRGWSVERALS